MPFAQRLSVFGIQKRSLNLLKKIQRRLLGNLNLNNLLIGICFFFGNTHAQTFYSLPYMNMKLYNTIKYTLKIKTKKSIYLMIIVYL